MRLAPCCCHHHRHDLCLLLTILGKCTFHFLCNIPLRQKSCWRWVLAESWSEEDASQHEDPVSLSRYLLNSAAIEAHGFLPPGPAKRKPLPPDSRHTTSRTTSNGSIPTSPVKRKPLPRDARHTSLAPDIHSTDTSYGESRQLDPPETAHPQDGSSYHFFNESGRHTNQSPNINQQNDPDTLQKKPFGLRQGKFPQTMAGNLLRDCGTQHGCMHWSFARSLFCS